eukprot:TRINITY_DN28299_c0_g1_i1.p1 TRINITY_DN28299_c0_g1~~TRINITY_DN28299_c0_g1_i1.p1  ORF type:complete len:341 (+),score=44.45 TRINITY_DN28299_c0_g1_i1:38-1060(+)
MIRRRHTYHVPRPPAKRKVISAASSRDYEGGVSAWSGTSDSSSDSGETRESQDVFPRPKRRLYDAVRKFEKDTHLPSSLARRRWSYHHRDRDHNHYQHHQKKLSLFDNDSLLKWNERIENYGRLDIRRLENWSRHQIVREMKRAMCDDEDDDLASNSSFCDLREKTRRVSYLLYYDIPHSEFTARRDLAILEVTERARMQNILRISRMAVAKIQDMHLRFKALIKRESLERCRTVDIQQTQWSDFLQVQRSELAAVIHGWGLGKQQATGPSRPKHVKARVQISFSGCPLVEHHECVFFASSQFDISEDHFKRKGLSDLREISDDNLPADIRKRLRDIATP